MDNADTQLRGRRLATPAALPKVPGYEWLTIGALRHLIFNAQSRKGSRGNAIQGNGLQEAGAILRIGRKVLIDLDAFDNWIDQHRDSGVSS